MTKFKVRLVQQVLEETWIEVDAADACDAGDIAFICAANAGCEWTYLEICEDRPLRVDVVTKVEVTETREDLDQCDV